MNSINTDSSNGFNSDTEQESSKCSACGSSSHSFDILCYHCGNILIAKPTAEQLNNAYKIAKIRNLHHHSETISTDQTIWQKVMRPLVPVLATLIIAIGGWIITSNYNRSQLSLQEKQLKANRQTAEVDASMAYIEFIARVPTPSIEQRDQAAMVVAPILPPELSFSLAVNRLPEMDKIIALLLRIYGAKSWQYISPHIEGGEKTQDVLKFLDSQNVLRKVFYFLISTENTRFHRRLPALIEYFSFLVGPSCDLQNRQAVELVKRLNADPNTPNDVKSDLSTALSLAFPVYMPDEKILHLAAERYWEKMDISIAEMPTGLKLKLYNERFHYQRIYGIPNSGGPRVKMVTLVSQQLLKQLLNLELQSMTIDEIGNLLYSYSITDPPTYLLPTDSFHFVKTVLEKLKSATRRQEFSFFLGSMSGHILYRNIGKNVGLKRNYAEMMIEWYEKYAQQDWAIPKFLHDVERDFPEFKSRIVKIFKKV